MEVSQHESRSCTPPFPPPTKTHNLRRGDIVSPSAVLILTLYRVLLMDVRILKELFKEFETLYLLTNVGATRTTDALENTETLLCNIFEDEGACGIKVMLVLLAMTGVADICSLDQYWRA